MKHEDISSLIKRKPAKIEPTTPPKPDTPNNKPTDPPNHQHPTNEAPESRDHGNVPRDHDVTEPRDVTCLTKSGSKQSMGTVSSGYCSFVSGSAGSAGKQTVRPKTAGIYIPGGRAAYPSTVIGWKRLKNCHFQGYFFKSQR